MHSPAAPMPQPPLRVSAWLITKLLAVAIVTIPMVAVAGTSAERLVTVLLPSLAAVGIVSTHGLRAGRSRLPAATQGLAVGLYLGVTIAFWLLDGFDIGLLGWGVVVAAFHPAVLPARLLYAVVGLPDAGDSGRGGRDRGRADPAG